MATEVNILRAYEIANRAERINIMLNNYTTLEVQIEIELSGIDYRIKEERAYQRRANAGDLGIRVKTSNISNPTFNQAYENIIIAEALENLNDNSEIFSNSEELEDIKRDIYIMEIIMSDYDNLKKQIMALKAMDRKVLLAIYADEVDIFEFADKEGIDYESVRSRIKRAKTRLREKMFIFWDKNQRRGI